MSVGSRIKKARLLRNLSQRELGLLLGFTPGTADVRIAQYELGIRRPREDMLRKLAAVLDVSYGALQEPSIYTTEDLMQALFELDDLMPVTLHPVEAGEEAGDAEAGERYAIELDNPRLTRHLREWQRRKRELAAGEISPDEYMNWKLNWPSTSDSAGRHSQKKAWRKAETEE